MFDGAVVLASRDTDLTLQFLAWRKFGFGELAHGNLALWNPHIFGGAPYFAGFQAALLYPPNWLHLIFSLGLAINLVIALHVFAAGYFAYLWCRRRASIAASILAGIMFMFAGPFFLHAYAGHLPHLCVIPWIPLILLSIDGIVETGSPRFVLLGIGAIAMQILAGHPQYVYYTGIIATLYASASIAVRRPQPIWPPIVGFIVIYIGASALTAIQLLPGVALTGETVRSTGLSYGMASTFAMPPENFLTMLAPNLLGALPREGDIADATQHYFGRGYLWEMSAFVSLTGAMLALYAAITMRDNRTRWLLVGTLLVCVLFALGRHTPLYAGMHDAVPMYGSFRGTTKFLAIGMLFVAMLAAIGFDRLLDNERSTQALVIAAVVPILLIALLCMLISTTSIWPRLLDNIHAARTTGEDNELFVDVPIWAYAHFGFIDLTARAAIRHCIAPAIFALVFAGALIGSMWRRETAHVLILTVAIEMLLFARGAHATSPASIEMPEAWRSAIDRSPRDARFITDGIDMNSPMYFGFNGVWGYDPGVLKRYAELITFTQGGDPSKPAQYITWRRRSDSVFRLLRIRAGLSRAAKDPVFEFPLPPLPTALLIRNYAVTHERDLIFRTLESQQFDPRSMIVLESQPAYLPAKGNSIGDVQIVRETTDALELRVNIESPAILLITNNFAEGWHARAIEPSTSQDDYTIAPANWTQQSIALNAGKHHVLVEYSPLSFRVGRCVSIFSIVAFVTAAYHLLRTRRETTV